MRLVVMPHGDFFETALKSAFCIASACLYYWNAALMGAWNYTKPHFYETSTKIYQ